MQKPTNNIKTSKVKLNPTPKRQPKNLKNAKSKGSIVDSNITECATIAREILEQGITDDVLDELGATWLEKGGNDSVEGSSGISARARALTGKTPRGVKHRAGKKTQRHRLMYYLRLIAKVKAKAGCQG